jgi:hypothetical protein
MPAEKPATGITSHAKGQCVVTGNPARVPLKAIPDATSGVWPWQGSPAQVKPAAMNIRHTARDCPHGSRSALPPRLIRDPGIHPGTRMLLQRAASILRAPACKDHRIALPPLNRQDPGLPVVPPPITPGIPAPAWAGSEARQIPAGPSERAGRKDGRARMEGT